MYTAEGAEALTEKLRAIDEQLAKVEAPDFTQKQSEEEESGEESENETWGDEVDL